MAIDIFTTFTLHLVQPIYRNKMSDVIKLLPDSVANQIAAGEVIQRPASVVKELVENAVDAGATSIKIIIKDAGRTLVQVVDNGSGMSDTDARLAFERHSTSKINAAADLFELHTMGFRGEALASIAAVSQVELRTRRQDENVGTRIVIAGSRVESQEPDGCPAGSNMMVKNLFFNVPARRKFLKKDSVELSNIIHEFERLALVNPDRELMLSHNDTTIHQLLRGSLKQRIGDLFGKSVERQLITVETETSLVKISGFVGLPEHARRRNHLQYFFVNGRNMRHPYFHKAVMSCYENLIASDAQPNYFLNFEVDPSTIDVNIHPTKNEIKFENEQPIWQILVAAIRESLGKFNVGPAIDFDVEDSPEIPVFAPDASHVPGLNLDSDYNPFAPVNEVEMPSSLSVHSGGGERATSFNWRRESTAAVSDWDKLYRQWESGRENPADDNNDEEMPVSRGSLLNQMSDAAAHSSDDNNSNLFSGAELPVSESVTVMQFKNRYILSPVKSGLMVIDQHRAHLRVLFEKYYDLSRKGLAASQQMIFPEMLRLTASESIVLESLRDQLLSIGFDISPLGDGSWAVNGFPAVLGDRNPLEILSAIVANVSETGLEVDADVAREVALSMARAAAIKPGQVLTTSDMEHLMGELLALATPTYTPDGHTIISIVDTDTLTKAF